MTIQWKTVIVLLSDLFSERRDRTMTRPGLVSVLPCRRHYAEDYDTFQSGIDADKNGVILNKWNDADLPDEYALTGKLRLLSWEN